MIKYLRYIVILSFPVACCSFLFTGCKTITISPEEQAKVPDSYTENRDTTNIATIAWKRFFPDTLLQNYIATALSGNLSFQKSLERIQLAQSSLKVAKGSLFPDVNIGLNAGLQRFGDFTMDGVGNSETNNTAGLAEDKHIPNPYSNFALGIGFSWEIDLWGKLTNKKRAALSRWMASQEAARLVQTELIAQVATCYFELVGLDRREAVLKQTIEQSEHARDLAIELKEAGNENQLAVDQFESLVLSLKGELLFNNQEIKARETALSYLMGQFPLSIKRISYEDLQKLDFPINEGIPAQLLQYRPDIREAELELLASKADVASAKASFFPSLVLGGSGGFNSFDAAKWFVSPASLVYDISAGLTAPLFQQNRIRAMWKSAKSNQRIALLNYHEQVLVAYNEVINALMEYESTASRLHYKNEEVKIHIRSVESAEELFKLNFAGYLEVLTAQEKLLKGELEQLDLNTMYCINHVKLYRALGGGWIEE
ncbi:MAG: TolC family protein [Bacteroidales bacterium]|nr:TolC family protein [Bacteroidales bacterium]